MLRQWQMSFVQPDEPGMGRLMLGHDDRLLLTDLHTQARMLGEPLLLHELLAALGPVVQQRYADLPDLVAGDMVLPKRRGELVDFPAPRPCLAGGRERIPVSGIAPPRRQ